ncbi:hypothetical protein GUITHDRAFT_138242 [Guillardia theta CCMP2712]|uniref:Lipase maturation factor n=3 Tax=Guillardia theta TaxID=55529 RepID=L1JDB6_GUITC|nr:hypothetical protein GUITHDRAFT_138242 [Guillardia theta CCMP2712]EKX46511.1 hypothetical protein GUITHDRAFT_138242 [Guillardia theta CCMP2712]|eukprot:XP_005833491.1 hypothetical protein GUITHDRAFT_138242 [Guillardia theta CCMP2712]
MAELLGLWSVGYNAAMLVLFLLLIYKLVILPLNQLLLPLNRLAALLRSQTCRIVEAGKARQQRLQRSKQAELVSLRGHEGEEAGEEGKERRSNKGSDLASLLRDLVASNLSYEELPFYDVFHSSPCPEAAGQTHLLRILLVRSLGFVYAVAFLIVALQGRPLVGRAGLSPVLEEGQLRFLFLDHDACLELIGWSGFLLSSAQCLGLVDHVAASVGLWGLYLVFYRSALHAEHFFHYGWDFQILETGFLLIFLSPTFCPDGRPSGTVLWLLRWLAFRVMLGAGRSKLMAQETCWRWEHLDCLSFHFETTGSPSPLGWFMHHAPPAALQLGVVANHAVELAVPWLILFPCRAVRLFAGVSSILFMLGIALTGNYAFLNHLTCVPLLACLDDKFLHSFFFPLSSAPPAGKHSPHRRILFSRAAAVVVSATIVLKSVVPEEEGGASPVGNLFGSHPWLQTFDSLFLVNAYGVFGSITKRRTEVVLSLARDGQDGSSSGWEEIEFMCKPDGLRKLPCFVTPYHFRFDWEVWIAVTAMGEHTGPVTPPFLRRFIRKVLQGDRDAMGLVRTRMADGQVPSAVKVSFYLYRASSLAELLSSGRWWERRLLREEIHRGEGRQLEQSGDPARRDRCLLLLSLGLVAWMWKLRRGGRRERTDAILVVLLLLSVVLVVVMHDMTGVRVGLLLLQLLSAVALCWAKERAADPLVLALSFLPLVVLLLA